MPKTVPDVKKRVSGVALLTASNLFVKAAGLLFKIPLSRTLGDAGMGYLNAAYSIYTAFYMISTAGLPVALAVLVAQNRAAGNLLGAKQIFRRSTALFVSVGLALSLVMLFFADTLASLIGSPASAPSIRTAAPTVCLISLSAAIRGYFQGSGNLAPTALSQFIEAAGRLVFGVGGALWAVRMGRSAPEAASLAALGLTGGSFFGLLYLLIVRAIRSDRDLLCGVPVRNKNLGTRETLSRVARLALPVTVGAAAASLSSLLDTVLIQRALTASGFGEQSAAALYGNYTSLAVPMFNLPPVLVYPVAYALTPAVAADLAEGNREAALRRITDALRFAFFIGLPCAAGLAVLADPILCLFFRPSSARLAAPLLTRLAPASFLVCVLAVTNAALQGCGMPQKPVVSIVTGSLVKAGAEIILLREFGIRGAPDSTLLCTLTAAAMNLCFLARAVRPADSPAVSPGFFPQRMGKDLLKLALIALCGGLCGVSAVLFHRGLLAALRLPERIAGPLSCAGAIVGAALVYFLAVLFTGAVGREELKKLKGRVK